MKYAGLEGYALHVIGKANQAGVFFFNSRKNPFFMFQIAGRSARQHKMLGVGAIGNMTHGCRG
ncbi:MAG: hypothetical protein BMS9Abin36_1059 [Gammaproteobacteria bacterium]|nr:MAG: hypothetical protein BMS9Abin36_1059 [Gammaproteobacteria bacterium]